MYKRQIQSMVANAQADGFILLYSKKDCPVAAYLRSEGLLHVIVGKAADVYKRQMRTTSYSSKQYHKRVIHH